MTVQRFDRTYIKDYKETPEGYLRLDNVPISRTGVFPYRRFDNGETVVEYEAKLPEDLLNNFTVQSATTKAVTDEHPPELVTAANHSKYAKGFTTTDAIAKDGKIFTSLIVTDSEMIDKIKNGKREISIGFTADIERRSGEYEGQRFDSVQRNITINHIAVVNQGRAGSDIGIRADSAAWQVDEQNKNGGTKMAKYIIDSTEYEVDATVKAHIDAVKAERDLYKKDSDELETVKAQKDAAEAMAATKETEIQKLKEGQLTQDSIDEAVKEHVALVGRVKPLIGDSFDFVGKTAREIKEEAIKTQVPSFDSADKTDGYVSTYFDAIMDAAENVTATSTQMKNGITSNRTDSNDSVEAMKQNRLNMLK